LTLNTKDILSEQHQFLQQILADAIAYALVNFKIWDAPGQMTTQVVSLICAHLLTLP
jgi:hypothetical protein